MVQVKEIINYQQQQDLKINEWLAAHQDVEIIDIKYSVGAFQEDNSCNTAEFSGALIIYRTKTNEVK